VKNDINILIVEDESLTALELANFLKNMGYNVVGYAANPSAAEILLKENKSINLILMDINLNHEINGIELYKNLATDAFLIYMTAYTDEEIISKAIHTNPLGFLVKPYNQDELKALLELASFKLTNKKEDSVVTVDTIDIGEGYLFDTKKNELFFEKKHIHLTAKELKLLLLLISYKGETVTFDTIEDEMYNNKPMSDSTIRTLIYRLRGKLDYKFIKNEFNYGISLNI
jgi:DNA-binding response OmpR family regulator